MSYGHHLPVLFEDADVLVVNKPAGMVVHPGASKESQPTVVDEVRSRVVDGDAKRPGIVHRLDKDTSGVLVITKHDTAKQQLQQQFRQRRVSKTYLAAVAGRPQPTQARIDVPIARHPKNPMKRGVRADGKPAITEYKTIDTKPDSTLLELAPHTGRTHQIRVHMHYIGHPIIGDRLYGGSEPRLERQFLHAARLGFYHPSGGEYRTFEAPLPPELADFWYN